MGQMKMIGIALIVAGAIVLFFGYNASGSVTDPLSDTLTGRHTDETMLYFIGGAILVVTGMVFIVRQ